MPRWFKSDKAEKTFVDATRGLATFNGAGIAGIIALTQRPGAIPWLIDTSGGLFLLGILLAGAAWFMAFIIEDEATETTSKMGDPMIACLVGAAAMFLFGVIAAFVLALNIPAPVK